MADFIPPEIKKAQGGTWIPPEVLKNSAVPQEKLGFREGETLASFTADPAHRRNFGKDLGSFAYGLGTGLYGMLGDITGGAAGPTTEETQGEISKQTGYNPASQGFVTAGEMAPIAVGVGRAIPSVAKALAKAPGALSKALKLQELGGLYESAFGGKAEKEAEKLRGVFRTGAETRGTAAEQEAARLGKTREQIEAGKPVSKRRAERAERFPEKPVQAQVKESVLGNLRIASREAKEAASKAGQSAVSEVKKTIDAARAAPVRGKELLNRITTNVNRVKDNLKKLADRDYSAAENAMESKFRSGNYWQNSPAGKQFIDDLRSRISTERFTEETAGTRSDLSKILDDVRGVVTDAKTGKISPASPKAMRETLRLLRDRARGVPETGYDAIAQQEAKDLADRLAKSIEPWEPRLAQADANYKLNAEALSPTKTLRAKRVLKPGEVDYKTPGVDPAKVPDTFFNSDQSVQELRSLVNDDAAVDQAAFDHVLDKLSGQKTVEGARNWLANQRTWMRPASTGDAGSLPNVYAKVDALVKRWESAEAQIATASEKATQAERLVGKQKGRLAETLKTVEKPEDFAARSKRAKEASENIRKAQEAAKGAKLEYDIFEKEISEPGLKPEAIASKASNYAKKLVSKGIITPGEYGEFLSQVGRINSQIASEKEAKAQLLKYAIKLAKVVGVTGGIGIGEELIRRTVF
jgi:hypothetical protein